MNRQLVIDGFGWGFVLWLVGYLLGILLFMFVPAALLGWVIMPIGSGVTVWVLLKQIDGEMVHFFKLAVIWTLIALLFDYIFLVKLLKPVDGYYKLDVYLYYLLTFSLPLIVGKYKQRLQR
jgi:hypothetical protein